MLHLFHAKRGVLALAASALMLLTTIVPLGAVTASHDAGQTDGLVVVAHARGATALANGELAVGAVQNAYVFDFSLHTATGAPFQVTEYAVDVHTIDGRHGEADPAYATLVWTARFTAPATSEGVVRVPASEVVWYAPEDVDGYHHAIPFGGLAFTLVAIRDGEGNLLRDPQAGTHYPAGSLSVLANELAAQGRWAQADQADEGPTPLLLVNGQHSGLVQPGNPVLNAGFEFGHADQDVAVGGENGSVAIPPWVLVSDDGAPATSHYIEGAAGASGSAVQIRYSPADNGRNLHFGQLFFVPGETDSAAWHGTESVKVEFDVRAVDLGGLMSSFHALGTLHWADDASSTGEAQYTTGPASGVPTDDAWRHVTLDFGPRAAGSRLTSFFFSFNLQAPAGSHLVVTIDNVRLTGARIAGAVEHKHDLNDGFSTFVLPTDLSLVGPAASQGGAVVQRLAQLNGQTAYVFRLSAMDYTGIDPQRVDLPAQAYALFQLLDQDFVASHAQGCGIGCADVEDRPFHALTNGANADAFHRYVDPSGQRADEYVVVVPAALAGSVVVPHLFVDVATGDTYEDAFGSAAEPSSAYHSLARNAMQFTALADGMDYHFTPVLLSSEVGGSFAKPATIVLDCPLMTQNVPCSADPAPDLAVTVTTASRVEETLTVELFAPALGRAVASAPLAAPGGGTVTLTVAETDMEAMRQAGLVQVLARVTGGLFTTDAETGLFELENVRPVASFTAPDLESVLSGETVAFASTSADSDGEITRTEWRVDLVEDASDDANDVPPGLRLATLTPGISYLVEDDGLYRVTLTVTDDGGAFATTSVDFLAANRAPTVTVLGPAYGRVGETLKFTYALADADGSIASHTVDAGLGPETRTLVAPIFATFAEGGVKTIHVAAVDDDGAAVQATRQVVIDDALPTTGLLLPATPSAGWFSGPVDVTVQRLDLGGSGIAFTTVAVGGIVEEFPGEDDFTLTIAQDGETTISAFTTDRAGNAEAPVVRTLRIDASAPEARVASARTLEGAPVEDVVFTDAAYAFAVAATDAASGVAFVELYVDGGEPVATLTEPGEDGLYAFSWTAAGTGVKTLWARVVDGVGHETTTQTVTILVI